MFRMSPSDIRTCDNILNNRDDIINEISCHKNVRIVLVENVNNCAYWSITCCTTGHSNTRCISSPISFIVQCSEILLIRGILGLARRPLSTCGLWHDVLTCKSSLSYPESIANGPYEALCTYVILSSYLSLAAWCRGTVFLTRPFAYNSLPQC
jgi:hypothetical protein